MMVWERQARSSRMALPVQTIKIMIKKTHETNDPHGGLFQKPNIIMSNVKNESQAPLQMLVIAIIN